MRRALGAAVAVWLGGCTYGVADIPPPPDQPTYAGSVRPFLSDHCFVCHSSPPDRGAPNYFRLDVYADDDATKVSGAWTMEPSILGDVLHDTPQLLPSDVARGLHSMPPGGTIGPNGKQLLINWHNDGALQ